MHKKLFGEDFGDAHDAAYDVAANAKCFFGLLSQKVVKPVDDTIPEDIELPGNQQDRDMIARELLVKFQMASGHPMVDLRKAYEKFS